LDGADHETVALPFPGEAETPVGADGAVGGALLLFLSTIVAASQTVFAPVPTVAFGGGAGTDGLVFGQEFDVAGV